MNPALESIRENVARAAAFKECTPRPPAGGITVVIPERVAEQLGIALRQIDEALQEMLLYTRRLVDRIQRGEAAPGDKDLADAGFELAAAMIRGRNAAHDMTAGLLAPDIAIPILREATAALGAAPERIAAIKNQLNKGNTDD